MFGVYFAPTRTFERLKEKPSWLLPIIIVVLVGLAVTLVSSQYVDWDKQREAAIERMQERGMTEEQMDETVERMEKFWSSPFMKYGMPLVGALVTQIIGILFLTVVFHLLMPLLGATGNFVRSLSVVAHASLVAIPGAVVRLILVLLKKSAEVSTSLLLAFPNLKAGFLSVLLGRIDVFVIWQFILLGLGLKVVFDIKGSKSYWAAFGLWAVVTLILAGLAMLGGAR